MEKIISNQKKKKRIWYIIVYCVIMIIYSQIGNFEKGKFFITYNNNQLTITITKYLKPLEWLLGQHYQQLMISS